VEDVVDRVEYVGREVSARRDEFEIETPWPAVTRLIYDFFRVHSARPLADLELAFWDATVVTRPMAGAQAAIAAATELGIPLGVVSNSSFRGDVIRHELAKHDLGSAMSIVVASADCVVRTPNPLLFELAASLIDVSPPDIWFIGDRLDKDVAGARASGMIAVLYAPGHESSGAHEADTVISTWDDLLPKLRSTR
jgi:FMN phosphatase YigB (HAD superfamily)